MSDKSKTPRVTGIGGIFFKSQDPKAMQAWYAKHLGVPVAPHGAAVFKWREAHDPTHTGHTVWCTFGADTDYFSPSEAPFMINYRVDDLHAILATLRDEGCTVMDKVEESEQGRFGWLIDPEGNKIELWEPPEMPKE